MQRWLIDGNGNYYETTNKTATFDLLKLWIPDLNILPVYSNLVTN